MKRSVGCLLALAVVVLISSTANARVVGYTEDTENFPNMLHTRPDCSQAYENYLNVAHPLNACHHLEEAKANLAAQQNIKNQMGSMKGCRKCTKMMVQADEAAAAYQEQIKLYKMQCPANKEQAKLMKKLPRETRSVCSACQNKWPGELGPTGSTPCK